jgi:hypothetical protein
MNHCDRTSIYSDCKFLSHELGMGQSQNRKWWILLLYFIIRMVYGLTWGKEEDALLDSTSEQICFRFPKWMCCPVANGSHASHKTVQDISSRQPLKYAFVNFVWYTLPIFSEQRSDSFLTSLRKTDERYFPTRWGYLVRSPYPFSDRI